MMILHEKAEGQTKSLLLVPQNAQDQADLKRLVSRAGNTWELRPKWLEQLTDELIAMKR